MRTFALIFILILTSTLYAQNNTIVLDGTVQDDKNRPISNATIIISSKNDSKATFQTVSNKEGKFKIKNISIGYYNMKVSHLEYETYNNDLSLEKDTSTNVLLMTKVSEMLDEVIVMAKYSDIKPNGETSIRVKGNPLAKGKTLSEFLQFIRDLDVSNDEISVRGRKNTLYYLDNQPISFEQLKNIQPSMIAHIDIIPHADASYGINATGGVIKIFLREEGGVLGSVTLAGKADYNGIKSTSPMATILYNRGKFSVKNFLSGVPYSRSTSMFEQQTETAQNKTVTDTKNNNRFKSLRDNLSLRYSFNKVTWLDVYGGTDFSWLRSGQNSTDGNNILSTSGKNKISGYNAGIQYQQGFGKDSLNYFRLRAEYSKNKENENADYLYNGIADNAALKSNSDHFSVQPIVHFKTTANSGLNIGLEYYYLIDRHEDNGTTTLGYIPTGHYTNKGYDYGAWIDYNILIKKKFYVYFALQYHGTQNIYSDYRSPENSTRSWEDGVYPSLFAQWLINSAKGRYLTFGFKHYYSLPNYNYRIPSVVWQSNNLYSIGNTNLKKENFYNMEIYYSFNSNWIASYNLTYCDDAIRIMTYQDETRNGTYYTKPENKGISVTHTFRIGYTTKPFKFWYNKNGLYVTLTHESMPGKSINNASIFFRSDNNFTLCRWLDLTLGIQAENKGKSLEYDYNGGFWLNAGAYMSFFNNNLNVALKCNQLIYTRNKKTIYGSDWTSIQKNLSHNTQINLQVTWNFNAGKKIRNKNLPSVNSMQRNVPTLMK